MMTIEMSFIGSMCLLASTYQSPDGEAIMKYGFFHEWTFWTVVSTLCYSTMFFYPFHCWVNSGHDPSCLLCALKNYKDLLLNCSCINLVSENNQTGIAKMYILDAVM